MLLEQAIEFEEVLKSYKGPTGGKQVAGKGGKQPQGAGAAANANITWDNIEELENYVARVQDAFN